MLKRGAGNLGGWRGLLLVLLSAAIPTVAQDSAWMAAAQRVRLMDAYLQVLSQPPCRLPVAVSSEAELAQRLGRDAESRLQALDQALQSTEARQRIQGIPARIDASLKAGESVGIAYRETCLGLAAQFRGARQRALADLERNQ